MNILQAHSLYKVYKLKGIFTLIYVQSWFCLVFYSCELWYCTFDKIKGLTLLKQEVETNYVELDDLIKFVDLVKFVNLINLILTCINQYKV